MEIQAGAMNDTGLVMFLDALYVSMSLQCVYVTTIKNILISWEMVNVRDIRGEDRIVPKQEDNSVPNVNESIFYMVFVPIQI